MMHMLQESDHRWIYRQTACSMFTRVETGTSPPLCMLQIFQDLILSVRWAHCWVAFIDADLLMLFDFAVLIPWNVVGPLGRAWEGM